MNNDFSYSNLLQIFFSNFKVMVIVGVLALVVSAVVSGPYFIEPKYRSHSVLYPSNLIPYSSETPSEQLLQLYHSSDVWDNVAEEFNLMQRYCIDEESSHAKFLLQRELNDNISISKTSFESVEISVLDPNPDTAKLMVEAFTAQVNLKARALQREKSKEVLVIAENQVNTKKENVKKMEDRFRKLSQEYGLLNYETQSEVVTEQFLESIRNGGKPKQSVQEMFDNITDKGGEFNALTTQLALSYEELNRLQVTYENALRDVNKELTYTNVIVHPQVPDKKAYPIRWLIVALSTFAAVLFAFVVLVMVKTININLVD